MNSINLVVKQDVKRIQRMIILMEYLVEKAMLFGDVFMSDNKQACLLILYSNKEKITFKSVLMDLKLAFKCIGIKRVFKVLKRQQIAKKHFPKEDHIRPMILAVMPQYKGKGTAARFMIQVKNHFKNNTLPVIIDAALEYNVRLYEKFGFKIIDTDYTLGFPLHFLRMNRLFYNF